MPELIGSFFGLKVIALLCLTVFLGNYSVIKLKHVFNGRLKVRSVISYGLGGLQIPRFDKSNLFLRRIANHKWLIVFNIYNYLVISYLFAYLNYFLYLCR